jgi:putative chitinase
MIFNRKVLFDGLRSALVPNTGFNALQVTSIGVIVDEFERRKLADVRWLAYILETVWHEARFMSVREIGRGKGKPYGVPHKLTGKVYYGRGFPQITWYANYLKFQTSLNLPLTTDPDMALIVPVSVAILFEGMTTGVTAKDSFTKYQLHDFFNDKKDDPVGARRIINGTDKALMIAKGHYKILAVLKDAMRNNVSAMKPQPPVQVEFDNPSPPVEDEVITVPASPENASLSVAIAAAIGIVLLCLVAFFVEK